MSVLTKNNYIKANALMSYTDIASADVEVLQQTATDMGYDEFAQATNGDLLMKKTEVVGSYTYVTTFNCRTEDVSVTVTEASHNIVFADPDVKAILVNKFGSDGEITEEQAAAVTTWFSGTNTETNPFYNNSNVNDTFDEFGTYFTSVSEIGSSAFAMCKMTSITLPSRVTYIGESAFASCTRLTSITIPNGVNSIGSYAFSDCKKLTSVTIPAGVPSIGRQAFYHCESLQSITIPASVTSIGDGAFGNCIKLTSIICEATNPPTLVSGAFNYTNDCPIYVPAESVDAYKAAEGWSTYADRIQAIAESENE